MEHQLAERKVGVDQAGTDRFTVRALSRGLMVLGLFDEDHPEWDLEGVVGETGIPRLSAQRTVRTMEEAGYLVFNAATNRYRLGPARHHVRFRKLLRPCACRPALSRRPGG